MDELEAARGKLVSTHTSDKERLVSTHTSDKERLVKLHAVQVGKLETLLRQEKDAKQALERKAPPRSSGPSSAAAGAGVEQLQQQIATAEKLATQLQQRFYAAVALLVLAIALCIVT